MEARLRVGQLPPGVFTDELRKNDAIDVLDPFQSSRDWFELELVGFQVKPAETCRLRFGSGSIGRSLN